MGSGSVYNKESYMLVIPDLIEECDSLLQDELFRSTVKKNWIPWSSQGMTDFVTLVQLIATQLSKPEYPGI
jgi:hypothetical protein